MKIRLTIAAVIGFVGLALPQAWGFLPPANEALTNYDRRFEPATQPAGLLPSGATLGPAQDQAVARLKALAPTARVTRDRLLASPRLITAGYGFLTGPGGSGGAVSGTALAAYPASDSLRVVKAFLNEHAELFGHDANVLTSARITRDDLTAHNGLHTVVWEQSVDGIPVFEGVLIGQIARAGELISISSQFVSDATQAANRGTPNRGTLAASPTISVAQAINLAAANIGVNVPDNSVSIVKSPEGAEKRQTARAPGLFGTVWGQLVWLPMDQSSMRLCWRVILAGPQLEHYMVLVDAETGAIPVRRRMTSHISPATYNVFTNDSPSPLSPGPATPNGFQPTNTTRSLITLAALNTNASPAGWIPDAGNSTSGNNAIAFRDRDLDELPDVPLPQGSPNRVFDFPQNLNQAPLSYASASTVQLFYRANWYHDRLYSMGFTESAGNFQSDNFGRGGFGADPLMALVQAGADAGFSDNAFFFTPPDGDSGICYMFVFTGPAPDRDGSLDSEVVLHEFTHGLSNRLLGGGVGISQLQTEGMGEGWSDFFALCLLSQATDDVNGVYGAGGYASYQILGFPFTDNYYFGIRRYPYSTDMTKSPLTFKDIDPNAASAHVGVPINPIFGGGNPAEVHNQGEVWCVTLREVWAALVEKAGWEIGNELTMQLVVDGLKLGPANATFLEARDAIIEADLLDTGGDNFVELWTAFAKRGMGFGATCPASDTTTGINEAYDLPPDLGNPDGILEVKFTPPPLEALFAGETNTILVRVTDVAAVTNATIVATISGGTNLVFRNDGVAPDQTANNAVYSASLKVPTNQPSISITLVISAAGKDTSTNTVTYFIIPPPPNDNFANAIKVPVGGTNYLSNNKIATLETNEPVHAGISSERASLWWNYTPTVNTNVLIDTGGSNIRTVLGVYTNSTLSTLQQVSAAVGSSSRPGALLKFNAIAGRTYRIAVAGYDSHNLGTLTLVVAPGGEADTNAPSVTITSPLNGQIVTTNRLLVTGSSVDSTPNASGIRSITIRVVAIPTLGPPITTTIPSVGPLNTNWASIVGLLPGLNSVQVTSTDFAGNRSVPAIIQVTYRVIDPPNDFFSAAIPLTGASGTNTVNTLNATKEVGEPNHAGFEGGRSAWWNFTPTNNGALTLSTINSTFDTVMAVYTGSSVNQLSPIASNDDAFDGAPGGYSQLVVPVRTNKTYRIAVDGYDGSGGATFLTWSFVPAPIFRLTISNTVGGNVTPSSMDVLSNSPVVLSAIPNANYQFDSWDGSVFSINNPLGITVNGDMNLTAHFRLADFTDGFETGDFSHLSWATSGNKPWLVQTNVISLGQFAARSGAITHNQNSSLLLTANFRAGTGAFEYRVSSEPSFDQLRFFVDAVQQQLWAGDTGWASFAFPLSAGIHTLEWRYSKDPSITAGLDSAFIDNVNLPIIIGTSAASAATLQVQRQSDGSLFINLLGQANQQYILQSSTNLVNWQGVSTNILVGGFLRIPLPVEPGAKAQFYRAVASP